MMVAKSKRVTSIAMVAAAVCIALLIFACNVSFLLSSNHYLYSLGAATATPQNSRVPVDSETAASISVDVVSYIRGGSERMQYPAAFTNEELSHLADVRHKVALFQASFYFLAAATAVASFIILALVKDLRKFVVVFGQVLFASGAIAVAISALFFLLSLDFDASFTVFHKILFGSSQWQFPSDYLLVNLFTADFFASFARAVVVAGFVGGLVLILVSLVMGKFYNPKAASISA